MGKTALITGATGMVGSKALAALLAHSEISKVIAVGRRKTEIQHKKLVEIIHDNFLDYSSIQKEFVNIDVCIYCLSVYQNQASKAEYESITCDYQKALTDVLEETNPELSFVLFGAAGADYSGKSRVTFARVKGNAEILLFKTTFPEKYVLRPGFINPTGLRKPPGFINKLALPIMKMMFKLFPGSGVHDYNLGNALVNVALNGHTKTILENSDIRKLEKL